MQDWRTADALPMFHRQRRPAGNPAGRKVRYCAEVGAFDIETSTIYDDSNNPHSFMYVWMFAIDDTVFYGRTWDEFRQFLKIIRRKTPDGYTLLTYVHNLSYEYQFLSGQFEFSLDDIFATEPRRILKLRLCDEIEMRCSYFLTNMDLRRFLQVEGVSVQKEYMDYGVVRYPWTPLTQEELSYCEADVLGLTQAIRSRARRAGDTWCTIPYTSTGYVRREAKRVMRAERRHDDYRFDTFDVYRMLSRAMRGGNTHASRYWAAFGPITAENAGQTLSRDFSSEYPYIICSRLFPSERFFVVPRTVISSEGDNVEYAEGLMSRGYAVLMRVQLTEVEVVERQHVPYLPFDKCEICHGASLDNGRLLYADFAQFVVTDVDWTIIRRMYRWRDARLTWCAYSRYAPLPAGYIELTRRYYSQKTALKGIDDYQYRRSKELLNSLYGMMAQSVLRMVIKMDNSGVLYEEPPEDMEKAYDEAAKKCFMPYSWGVWLTAHARALLQQAIDAVGDHFIYCDTDSVKYLDGVDVDFDALFPGDTFEARDAKGAAHRMGVMEPDAIYDGFVTLGAKKYAVVYAGTGKLEITVAGVGKVEGSKELVEKGGLTAFKPGLIFKTGGIDAVYNDLDDFTFETADGHSLEIRRNVSLIDGEYTLGVTSTYQDLLDSIVSGREIIDPFSL